MESTSCECNDVVEGNYGVSDYERLCFQNIVEVLDGKRWIIILIAGGTELGGGGRGGYLGAFKLGALFFEIYWVKISKN